MKKFLVPILSLRLLASSLSVTALVVGGTYHSNLNASEAKQYLVNHIRKVTEYMSFAKDWLERFFSKNNSRSYNEQIKEFKEQIDQVEREVVQQINGIVRKVPTSDEYHVMLTEMQVITNDVKKLITQIYKVLDENKTEKRAMFMGKNFLALNQSMNAQLMAVRQKLCSVYEKARRANAPFANELDALIRDVDAMVQKKVNPNDAIQICCQLIKCQR